MAKALTQEQAAALRGVTARRLRQMSQEDNPPPQDANGQYDPEEYGSWLRTASAGADYYKERARLTKEQADKAERENEIARGLIMDAAVVSTLWGKVATAAKTRLLAIPTKAAPLLVGRTIPEIKETLEELVYECAASIARDPMGEDMDSAPEADGKRMGGRKQDAKSRERRGAGEVAD